MSGAGTDGAFEVAVEPRNDRYDPDDDGWRDQVATLFADLDAQVNTVRRARPVAGCSLTLTDAHGNEVLRDDSLYGLSVFQVQQTGSFRWQATPGCAVAPLAGRGSVRLPFALDQSGDGDTAAFAAPPRVAVHVKDYHGDADCRFYLHDAADGRVLDFQTAQPGHDTVTLAPGGSRSVYLGLSDCAVQVSAG